MIYEKKYEAPFPMLEITMRRGEEIRIEPTSLVYCDKDMEFENRLNKGESGGGFFSALARSAATNESMFITHVLSTRDNSKIAIGSPVPGDIYELKCGEQQWRVTDGAFLACDEGVNYRVIRQSWRNAIFGTGGLFIMETTGNGSMLIDSCGALHKITLDGTKPITIDNTHLVAWSSSLNYETRFLRGTWEFAVCDFSGIGTIILQTSCRTSRTRSIVV
jgi:uncharacterized protein (TIGR00266 family)